MVGRKQENKKRHRKEPQGGLRSDRDMENVYIYIYIYIEIWKFDVFAERKK
jgi:hypothetical protein